MAKTNNLTAILNYAKNYDSVSKYLGTYDASALISGNGTIAAGDMAKIFFTGDGHIISHGVDYTPTFIGGYKGLVPESTRATDLAANANAKFKFLGNDGGWKELTVAELPMAGNFADGMNANADKVIYSAGQVYQFFNDRISAAEVMRFKGVFAPGVDDDITVCEKGDTYRINTPGGLTTYANMQVQTGDLLICIKDSPEGATAADIKNPDNQYWMVVESNINGTATHTINGVGHTVYTDSVNNNFTIFAPTTGGTAGNVLISKGDAAPEWVDPKGYDLLSDDLKKQLVKTITVNANGSMEWKAFDSTSLGTYNPDTTNHHWNISINGLSAGVKSALTVGEGLIFEGGKPNFDGQEARNILLQPATKTTLGGVKIDNTAGSIYATESTVSVDESGMIYITKENISNALGFVPGTSDNVFSYSNVISNTTIGTSDAASVVESPYFNLVAVNEKQGSIPEAVSSTKLEGANGIKVTGTAGKLLFDLQEATDTVYGGIKVFKKNALDIDAKTTDGLRENRYYGVELDKSGKAFVYVPWVDENPAFNKINIEGAGLQNLGGNGTLTADNVNSEFTVAAGNGINLTVAATNKIIINQDIWDVVSSENMGYAPKMEANGELTDAHYILSYVTGQAPTWNRLPEAALRDTWRAVQVGGSALADNKAIDDNGVVVGSAINFTASGHTKLDFVKSTSADTAHIINISSTWRPISVGDANLQDDYSLVINPSDDIVVSKGMDAVNKIETISFELVWHNIDEGTIETTDSLEQ